MHYFRFQTPKRLIKQIDSNDKIQVTGTLFFKEENYTNNFSHNLTDATKYICVYDIKEKLF